MMIGNTRNVCAMIIASGVKSRPYEPKGPARDSSRYTSKPTTTGGKPMKLFKTAITNERPGKGRRAISAANGRPINVAIKTADVLIFRDSTTISIRSESKPVIKSTAVRIAV